MTVTSQVQANLLFGSSPFSQKLAEIVEANYADNTFDVVKLGQFLNLCSMQVHRKVKRHTGLSPGRYLLLFRLKKSCFMLQNEEIPIGQIAFQTGFYYHHTYTRAFKRTYGCSPKQMRLKYIST